MPEIREGQTVALLQELHILTRDGKMNQDSRRKLKQVYHLYQFIEPLLKDLLETKGSVSLVDHGAGKSYGLHHLRPVLQGAEGSDGSHIYGIETREELVSARRNWRRNSTSPHVLPAAVGGRVHRIEAAARADRYRHGAACLQHGHR
jgi:hypothetical protein